MTELKPCPFCGDDSADKNTWVGIGLLTDKCYQVQCPCGTCGPLAMTDDEAIAAWNRRADVKEESQ